MVIDRVDIDSNESVWFAMQATQRREEKAQEILKQDGIKSFIPMRHKVVVQKGRKQVVFAPVIPNLMFVYATKSYMAGIKLKIPYLQFKYRTENRQYYPIIVPTKQMEDFIRLYDSIDSGEMQFIEPNDPVLQAGKQVRIHSGGGVLDGIEGKLVKIKGKRQRQLSISIDGFITIVAAVNIDWLEIL